jgi:antitoxin YxxD
MSDFSFLKKYVLPSVNVQAPPEYKHVFYPLDICEVEEAEHRLNRTFPKELREFYLQIGYGFMCIHQKTFDNRIMDPDSLADLILGEDIWEDYDLMEEIGEPHLFPFFFLGNDDLIFFDLSQETREGIHPVDYGRVIIAESLEDFLRKLDAKENYYINVVDDKSGF